MPDASAHLWQVTRDSQLPPRQGQLFPPHAGNTGFYRGLLFFWAQALAEETRPRIIHASLIQTRTGGVPEPLTDSDNPPSWP